MNKEYQILLIHNKLIMDQKNLVFLVHLFPQTILILINKIQNGCITGHIQGITVDMITVEIDLVELHHQWLMREKIFL